MIQENRKPIKLLVVSQYYYPEQFRINDICAEWVKRGYDVTVVTGIPNYPQGKFYSGYGYFKKRREIHEGVEIIRLPIISRGNSNARLALNYVSFVVSGFFWQLFTRQKAEIVFSFEVSPMTQVLPAVWFANRKKISCLVYVQDLWPENFQEITGIKDGFLISQITRMTNYIYQQCKMVLVTSNSFKKVIENRGVPSEKVVYWPQYAEEFYKPSKNVSSLVPPDDRLTIAYTGNIGTSQGLEILPKTASLLREKGYSIRFVLVGDGRGMPNLKKSIENEDVENCFLFIPQQSPEVIPDILARADAAFISFSHLPLFAMTLPAKLQSYMACGMIIVAAVSGETERIVKKAECGFVTTPGTPVELVDVLITLHNASEELKSILKRNSYEYCQLHFNKNRLMNEIDRFLLL